LRENIHCFTNKTNESKPANKNHLILL